MKIRVLKVKIDCVSPFRHHIPKTSPSQGKAQVKAIAALSSFEDVPRMIEVLQSCLPL